MYKLFQFNPVLCQLKKIITVKSIKMILLNIFKYFSLF